MLLLDLGHFASIEPFMKGVSSHTRRDAERSVAVRWIENNVVGRQTGCGQCATALRLEAEGPVRGPRRGYLSSLLPRKFPRNGQKQQSSWMPVLLDGSVLICARPCSLAKDAGAAQLWKRNSFLTEFLCIQTIPHTSSPLNAIIETAGCWSIDT